MSMFCTSCVTFVPGLMISGQYASSGTRIEGSYMCRLSIRPCSPKQKPLSPM